MPSQKRIHRRSFIEKTIKASVATGFLMNNTSAHNAHAAATPFVQQPLPYAYNALEPAIDALTMEIHYSKHAAAYSKNLIDACTAETVNMNAITVESILSNISKYSTKMRNNCGGHFNHEFFWKTMTPASASNKPNGKILQCIEKDFGSVEAMQTQYNDAAKNRFGSGWAWLIFTNDKKLQICSTPNQDNTLMDNSEIKGTPLIGLDVWEHAYYLKYQNKRTDYVSAWWQVVNWEVVNNRLQTLL